MRILFLHGRLYSPDGDGGGGGAAAATGDANPGTAAASGDTAGAAAAAAAPDPTPAPTGSQGRGDSNELLGGLPANYGQENVPRGTPEPKPADKQPDATPDAAAAAPTPAPAFDFTKIAGGKFKDEDSLLAAITAAETTSATLADPQVQAFVEMSKDPAKAAEFYNSLSRDYVAEAKSDPKGLLFAQYRADNPDYSEAGAKLRFEREYREKYPNLDIADPEDTDYQESVLLRDEDAAVAARKRTAAQATQKEEFLKNLPKLTPAEAAAQAKPLVSEAEVAAHAAGIAAANAALTERTVKVPLLDAAGVKIGEETVTLGLGNREDATLLMDDAYAYFEKAGITDAEGNFNYPNLQQFALRAVNYDADIQAAVQRGIALGAAKGAAAVINPGDNPQARPDAARQDTPGTPGQPIKSNYWDRQNAAVQNIPEV